MKSETPIRELTAAARAGLSGSWGKSIGIFIVYMILITGASHVPFIGWLLPLVFAAPMIVGLNVYFLDTVRKKANPFALLFAGFDRFGSSWCTYMLVLLIVASWVIPFVALGVLVKLYVHPDPSIFPVYTIWALYAVLGLLMSAVMIGVQMRYYLALYVVADDGTVRARQAVRRSVKLMKGNYWRLCLLWLRFIGWQLLCVLTFGIGFLWLVPYMMAANVAFYDDLAGKS